MSGGHAPLVAGARGAVQRGVARVKCLSALCEDEGSLATVRESMFQSGIDGAISFRTG
jgi:hypothetical protein